LGNCRRRKRFQEGDESVLAKLCETQAVQNEELTQSGSAVIAGKLVRIVAEGFSEESNSNKRAGDFRSQYSAKWLSNRGAEHLR
jgi:hypothetical protein